MSIGGHKEIQLFFRINDGAGSYSVSIEQVNTHGFDPSVVGPLNGFQIIGQITIYPTDNIDDISRRIAEQIESTFKGLMVKYHEAFKFNSKIK